MVEIVRKSARWVLVIVTVFNALSAIAGGVAVLTTNGLGMPMSMLKGSPFTSFAVPGLVLLLVVGGTQAAASVLLLMRRDAALVWTAIAGFGMIIWIFVETGIIRGMSWLQGLYFASGVVQLVLVIALLGAVRWLPRAPREGIMTHDG